MILQYKVFETNEEFVQWQKDNSGVAINQVCPLLSGMDLNGTGSETESNFAAKTTTQVFVLYHFPEPTPF